MTFERWCVTTVLGCAALWTALMPPSYLHEGDDWREETQSNQPHVAAWWARYRGRAQHRRDLWIAYRSTTDLAVAAETFGSRHATPGEADVRFANGVPEATRAPVLTLLERERTARGEWRARGAVGVLVTLDAATAYDVEPHVTRVGDSWRLSTRVLVPAPAFGNRCVTVVRLHGPVPARLDPIASHRPLLDGCAFFDAFGQPGAEVSRWLAGTGFGNARMYEPVLPDSLRPLRTGQWDSDYFAGGQMYSASRRCRAGADAACMELLDSVMTYDARRSTSWVNATNAGVAPELFRRDDRNEELGALARELGAPRFERVWKSPKPLARAYLDETGEPLTAWIRRQELDRFTDTHVGPGTSPWSVTLTLLSVVALFWISTRFVPRPQAA